MQHPQAVAEIEKQVGRLVHKRFLADLPCERLNHLPRYLKTAQELRIPMPVSVKRLQKRWEGMGRCSRKAAALMDATGKGIASTSAWAV
ncbi:hypothetical protein ACCUM_0058 [Candidatus Accumulibacter phosphatis]|uniref:RNA helicase HrpA C-terminal domain-containing protein n=1 Tax=Candidatus Accumulibacter phosphatis TaxID=327160 RepID=A0A5S4EH00_9PROT|nr:hypothetical protein ACCUM_0058 [Candidatus Accumulibacter phosphatis]